MNYKRKRFSSGACHPSHTSFAAQQQRPRLTALVPLMRCTDLLPRYASFLLVVLLLHISTAQAFVRHVNNCPGYTSWSSHWLGCNKIAYSRGGTRSSGRTDTVASTNDEWRSTSIRDDESHGSRAFPDEKKLHSGDSLPVDRDHWHENETTYRSNEQHEDDSAAGLFQNYNVAWLGQATTMMLDRHEYPTGTLTDDDWKVLKRLMAEWPRQRSVAAAMTVEQLIKRAVEEVHSRDRRSFTSSPSSSARQSTLSDCSIETSMYVSCLNAWAWSGDTVVAAIRAQSIHDEMTRTWRETGNSLTAPSTASYNALLNAWSKYKNSNNPVLGDANSTATSACLPMTQSESILLEMIKGGENVKPDDTTVMTLLNVYAKSFAAAPPDQCRKDHVQRCGQLVEVMQREWRIQPSVATYLSLQRAYARSGLSEASLLVERVIHTMLEPCAAVPQQLGSDGAACVAVQPTTANFNGT